MSKTQPLYTFLSSSMSPFLGEEKKNKKKDVLAAVPVNQAPPAECSIINATFILLIHGVVFSTSKKDDYPPLVSNVGWESCPSHTPFSSRALDPSVSIYALLDYPVLERQDLKAREIPGARLSLQSSVQ
ncbi:NADH-ubiquinone oxidoreductase chain 2 [Carex littledalei]|uniref:NADH-ubiquinone oxidoreductase chain 2 n=1 Tax=Carex littledalei TaxID=544730 RepID=A0A833RDV1_9POAL|nr:NADH-ubiquinone oxidoreductase chain 2 [Carex littledalei]